MAPATVQSPTSTIEAREPAIILVRFQRRDQGSGIGDQASGCYNLCAHALESRLELH